MNPFDPKKIIDKIPKKPGVYQFFNADGVLIYVGKAKSLRNRVQSYFNKEANLSNAKTRILVSKIRDIQFTIVDTEIDAWLLENNLIKKHQPKYNISLKDDKTYPSICIKKERFPRIFWTRKIIRDGSTYFGPYASFHMMKTILDLVKELYPLRTCTLQLSKENIEAGKFKVCLEYQIGNCKGPCQNLQSEEEYKKSIEDIQEILKGEIGSVLKSLHQQLTTAVAQLDYEQAHQLKFKIESLENYQSKSAVVSTTIHNVDVFSIASDERYAFVNYLKVANGTVIQTQTIELKKRLDETDEELLSLAISEFRQRYDSTAKEIVVPFEMALLDENIKFTVPKAGDKKKLIELSLKNVLYFKKSKLEQYEKLNPELRTERVLSQLQKDLRLTELPRHIECFDNSNFQGKYPVSAMVLFRDGKPSRKEYRHYNIKTVEGPNDFASMAEVVHRRYARLLDENVPLPNLIVVDGGKGQLSAALESLKKLDLHKKIPIIGIAKRLEEIYYPGDSFPLYLDKKSESLKIIQHLRDEAHRFGITFHRQKRNKGTIVTELESIDGVGKTSAQKLLSKFKSVKKIREASLDELTAVVKPNIAQKVKDYFGA